MNRNERAQYACLVHIADPSHSWLGVSLDSEHGFPEAINYASEYSYLDISADNFAGVVWLEEDSDMFEFVKDHGIDVTAIQFEQFDDTDHFIRNLPRAKEAVR